MVELKSLGKMAGLAAVLSIIVLVMLVVVTGFGKGLRTTSVAATNSVTVAANNSFTDFGTTRPFVQSVTGCVNQSSVPLTAANYTVFEGTASGGGIVIKDGAAGIVGTTINCTTVTYLAASDASGVANTFVTGMTIFATFMAVIILALVGGFVVKLFKV